MLPWRYDLKVEGAVEIFRGRKGACEITLLTFPRFQELDDMKLFVDKVMPALA